MNQTTAQENGELTGAYMKQEAFHYSYDPNSYLSYTSGATAAQAAINQPLPGQPPLPPMPPPSAAVPPPPSVFAPVPSQVAQMHAWHAPTWQWIPPQPPPLPPPSPRDTQASMSYSRDNRNNFVKRDKFNHTRYNAYSQRDNNYHRKNRRRYDHGQSQYDSMGYHESNQRGHEASSYHSSSQNQMNSLPMSNASKKSTEQNVKTESKDEIVVKKGKQKKPMSLSYPSRPWNKEDAEKVLRVENEYNRIVKAQSLIIKFPDPDLNKDIVRKFHNGIQNIHFQSPSGPRYCFIQMADDIDIDQAIKDMEEIPFGTGFLKVERKSCREDKDNRENKDNHHVKPEPGEIDPYTLYIGNLPESVNVNEVKSKFPTAIRVDVGFAQKMRKTRYAFIRYNSVDESIAAYKEAHNLMWDTRSIIVRFRRHRGTTCSLGESKVKTEKVKLEQSEFSKNNESNQRNKEKDSPLGKEGFKNHAPKELENTKSKKSLSTENCPIIEIHEADISNDTDKHKQPDDIDVDLEQRQSNSDLSSLYYIGIKEEPEDYEEMDEMPLEEDDDDDDDEDQIIQQNYSNDDSNNDEEDAITNDRNFDGNTFNKNTSKFKDDIPSDHLDRLFNNIDRMARDIEL